MIRIAMTDDEIASCHAVLAELRPHLAAQDRKGMAFEAHYFSMNLDQ